MQSTSSPSVKVFLVADDEDDYKLIQALLSKSTIANYSLEREASFESALSRMNGFAHDIYLVDCHFGEKNGLELIMTMVGKGCRKPIILLTGQGSYELDVLAIKTGAPDYLDKADLKAPVLDRAIRHAMERKRVESAIAGAKKQWEYTFDAMPDLIMIVDRQYRLRRVNKAMAERLGTQPGRLIGKVCYEVVHGLDSPPEFCPHAQLLKQGVQQFIEMYEKNLGGYFSVSVSPYYDEQSRLVGSILVARDINIFKTLEEKFHSMNKQLEGLVAAQSRELRAKTAGIEEMNTALKVLLRQREQDRNDVEESVAANIRGALIPFIRRLKNTVLNKNQVAYLDTIESRLKEIASPLLKELFQNKLGLTPTEAQIVSLLREGKTSKEIAQTLNVSINTVKFHRMNLRRKLGLNGRNNNLRAKLETVCKSMILPCLFPTLFLSLQDLVPTTLTLYL